MKMGSGDDMLRKDQNTQVLLCDLLCISAVINDRIENVDESQ